MEREITRVDNEAFRVAMRVYAGQAISFGRLATQSWKEQNYQKEAGFDFMAKLAAMRARYLQSQNTAQAFMDLARTAEAVLNTQMEIEAVSWVSFFSWLCAHASPESLYCRAKAIGAGAALRKEPGDADQNKMLIACIYCFQTEDPDVVRQFVSLVNDSTPSEEKACATLVVAEGLRRFGSKERFAEASRLFRELAYDIHTKSPFANAVANWLIGFLSIGQ